MSMGKWWGYKHVNGSYQAKRYFDEEDIVEAEQSPFCDIVVNPFYASDRDMALGMVKRFAG